MGVSTAITSLDLLWCYTIFAARPQALCTTGEVSRPPPLVDMCHLPYVDKMSHTISSVQISIFLRRMKRGPLQCNLFFIQKSHSLSECQERQLIKREIYCHFMKLEETDYTLKTPQKESSVPQWVPSHLGNKSWEGVKSKWRRSSHPSQKVSEKWPSLISKDTLLCISNLFYRCFSYNANVKSSW